MLYSSPLNHVYSSLKKCIFFVGKCKISVFYICVSFFSFFGAYATTQKMSRHIKIRIKSESSYLRRRRRRYIWMSGWAAPAPLHPIGNPTPHSGLNTPIQMPSGGGGKLVKFIY
jgi:hypothetical protein